MPKKTPELQQEFEQSLLQNHSYQPCVLDPRDPVTGERPEKSYGMYGPHLTRRHYLLFGRRIMWMEYPLDVGILRDTPHALVLPAFTTMWARCRC